jgi:PAS domain S-box-containing protein
MTIPTPPNTLRQGDTLRRRAEEAFRKKAERIAENVESLSPRETRDLLHELQVHQIELEMQNEELRRAQEALDALRARYFDLYDLAPVGYCTISEKGLILEANLTAATLWGAARGVLAKRPLSDFILPADMDIFYRHHKLLFETGLPQAYEIRMLRQDGKTFWARMESAVTLDEEGASVCRTVISDITDRKRAEEELAENTAKLAEINRDLEDFNYSVSNDLRVPLRAIDGFSRMILQTAGERFDEETRRRFRVIIENIEKIGRIIEDLLAFSRVGRRVVSKRSLDMEEMVRDVWQELLAANPGRKMTLKLGKMPAASGDWSMIRQVYANLLENAVKFAEGRNPTVIEVGSLAGEEGAVYYVWDNGIGFDMKFHDKLFGVFKRLHTDAEFEGTGIGLSLVQRIVHRHGGKIWAEGEVDKGATFSFTLPTRQE